MKNEILNIIKKYWLKVMAFAILGSLMLQLLGVFTIYTIIPDGIKTLVGKEFKEISRTYSRWFNISRKEGKSMLNEAYVLINGFEIKDNIPNKEINKDIYLSADDFNNRADIEKEIIDEKSNLYWLLRGNRLEKFANLINEKYYNDYSNYNQINEIIDINSYGKLVFSETHDNGNIKVKLMVDKDTKEYVAISLGMDNISYEKIKDFYLDNYEYISTFNDIGARDSLGVKVDKYKIDDNRYIFVLKNLNEDFQGVVFINKKYLATVISRAIEFVNEPENKAKIKEEIKINSNKYANEFDKKWNSFGIKENTQKASN